jgi:hypothetical protein
VIQLRGRSENTKMSAGGGNEEGDGEGGGGGILERGKLRENEEEIVKGRIEKVGECARWDWAMELGGLGVGNRRRWRVWREG